MYENFCVYLVMNLFRSVFMDSNERRFFFNFIDLAGKTKRVYVEMNFKTKIVKIAFH